MSDLDLVTRSIGAWYPGEQYNISTSSFSNLWQTNKIWLVCIFDILSCWFWILCKVVFESVSIIMGFEYKSVGKLRRH